MTNAAEAGAELRNNSRRLAQTLTSFGVDAQPGDVVRGPSVTRYEFTLSQGVTDGPRTTSPGWASTPKLVSVCAKRRELLRSSAPASAAFVTLPSFKSVMGGY